MGANLIRWLCPCKWLHPPSNAVPCVSSPQDSLCPQASTICVVCLLVLLPYWVRLLILQLWSLHVYPSHSLSNLLYSDLRYDIIITYSDPTALVTFIRQLGVASFIKDLGNLFIYFWPWTPTYFQRLLLKQRYILDLLYKVNMHDAIPVTSPLISAQTLSQVVGDAFSDPTLYRSTVGWL